MKKTILVVAVVMLFGCMTEAEREQKKKDNEIEIVIDVTRQFVMRQTQLNVRFDREKCNPVKMKNGEWYVNGTYQVPGEDETKFIGVFIHREGDIKDTINWTMDYMYLN